MMDFLYFSYDKHYTAMKNLNEVHTMHFGNVPDLKTPLNSKSESVHCVNGFDCPALARQQWCVKNHIPECLWVTLWAVVNELVAKGIGDPLGTLV